VAVYIRSIFLLFFQCSLTIFVTTPPPPPPPTPHVGILLLQPFQIKKSWIAIAIQSWAVNNT
jgi:hypothetical protein